MRIDILRFSFQKKSGYYIKPAAFFKHGASPDRQHGVDGALGALRHRFRHRHFRFHFP
jgi:hypothetical protein